MTELTQPRIPNLGGFDVPGLDQFSGAAQVGLAVCGLIIVVMVVACLAVWATTRRRRGAGAGEQQHQQRRYADVQLDGREHNEEPVRRPGRIQARMHLVLELDADELAVAVTALSHRYTAAFDAADEYRRRTWDPAEAEVMRTLADVTDQDAGRAYRLYRGVEAATGGQLVLRLTADDLATLTGALADHVHACLLASAHRHTAPAPAGGGDAWRRQALVDSYAEEAVCARQLYLLCGGAAARLRRPAELEEQP